MARRTPKEEKPYSPIEAALIQRIAFGAADSEQRERNPSLQLVAKEGNSSGGDSSSAVARRQGREKRVILSWEDECALQKLLEEISLELETPIKLSNVLRACVMLLRHADESIRSNARRSTAFIRPANNDQPGLTIFEHRIAQILLVAFKDADAL